MPRKMTPLRAASETRASAKKQVKSNFEIEGYWLQTFAEQAEELERAARVLRDTISRAQRDLEGRFKADMKYFDQQRARQKAKKGGL